jgi:hypothetical protein
MKESNDLFLVGREQQPGLPKLVLLQGLASVVGVDFVLDLFRKAS